MNPARSGPLERRSITHDARATAGATMTPMVDVVLVILIFFMGSATIAGHEWFLRAAIDRGEDAPAQAEDGAPLTVPVPVFRVRLERSGGASLVSGVAPGLVPLSEAAERIGVIEFGGGSVVELGATDDVPLADVVRVHDALNARGVRVTLR